MNYIRANRYWFIVFNFWQYNNIISLYKDKSVLKFKYRYIYYWIFIYLLINFLSYKIEIPFIKEEIINEEYKNVLENSMLTDREK